MEGKYPGGPPDPYQGSSGPPQYPQYPGQPVYIPQQPGFVMPQPLPPTGPMYPHLDPNQPLPDPVHPHPPPPYTETQQPQQQAPAPVARVIIKTVNVGPEPIRITCPSCHTQITSDVRYVSSMKTHIVAAILCFIGCWPCACIPYCVDSCQSGNHYCPACQAYLGTYTATPF